MRQLLASAVMTAFFVAVLLLCAGRFDYWQAWLYAGLSTLMNLGTRWVQRTAPEVTRERAKPGADAKGWDKALLGVSLLLNLVTFVLAGLDSGRLHRAASVPWAWVTVGLALALLGTALFLWAMGENRFFSAVVRIQTERAHHVCTTGPYRWVRHPGYAGMLLGTLGLPLLFTSWWSAVPSALSALLLLLRTHLEDQTLARELTGYQDYQSVTRTRLLPGVW